MISMRYARNLAEGFGLVWNAGERPGRGLYESAVDALDGGHPLSGASDEHARSSSCSGAVLLLATAALAARIATRLRSNPRSCTASAFALVAFNYALVFWTLRGMEAGLALPDALVTGPSRSRCGPKTKAAAVLPSPRLVVSHARPGGPTAATSPSSISSSSAHVAWTIRAAPGSSELSRRSRCRWRRRSGRSSRSAPWYYGDPWPNTYYLKLGGVTLLTRLRRECRRWRSSASATCCRSCLRRCSCPRARMAGCPTSRRAPRRAGRRPGDVFRLRRRRRATPGSHGLHEPLSHDDCSAARAFLAAAGSSSSSSPRARTSAQFRFAALLLMTLAARLMLEIGLHAANAAWR